MQHLPIVPFVLGLLRFSDVVVFCPRLPYRGLALFVRDDHARVVLLAVLLIFVSRRVVRRNIAVEEFLGVHLNVVVPMFPVFLVDLSVRNCRPLKVLRCIPLPLVLLMDLYSSFH